MKLFESLKWKVWLNFVAFATIILLLLWLFQIILLQSYYKHMKSYDVGKALGEIAVAYGKEDFTGTVDSIATKNGLDVFVVDFIEGETRTYNKDMQGGGVLSALTNSPMLLLYHNEMIKSPTSTMWHDINDPRTGRDGLLVGTVIWHPQEAGNISASIFIYASLVPLDSTAEILQSQFYIITVIVFFVAFVMSFFISWQLSKPIVKLTKSAEKLAEGDFNTSFESGGFTEVDKLAQTLNYAALEMSKVDGLRRDLIANISHDLRTPLTMVKAYAEMIRDLSGDNPVKRKEHLAVIIDEADRLTSLVTDILDLSRMESGNTEFRVSEYNISENLEGILQRYILLSEKNGYNFVAHIEPNVVINADGIRLEQVIYNLINNAVTYTGEDKTVTISLYRIEGGVRFEVSDTGEGIPPDELELIWDRYYKANSPHKRAVVGTGLGLNIVRTILDMHGFKYGADSEVGKGSTFWFEAKE